MSFFDLNNIAFTCLNYPMSWLEVVGTSTGLIAVWLSARENIFNWGIGFINILCFFVLFYQSGFYSDMFLQIYFFATGVYGWYEWARRDALNLPILKISLMNWVQRGMLCLLLLLSTFLLGNIIVRLPLWLPQYFPQPAAFPIADTAVMVMSMAANTLMARKKLEAWYLWVLVDILAPILYFQKQLYLMTLEYVIFGLIAAYGWYSWQLSYNQNYDSTNS